MIEPIRYTDPTRWVEFAQTLPQIKRIRPEAIGRWADHLSTLPEEEAAFHAQRVRGFGGSEIGVLLTEAAGGRDSWNTANWLVRQKLLELLPLPAEPQMMRGKKLESLARAALLRRGHMKADRVAMKAIEKPIETGKYAWMQGNPDVAAIQRDRRYLIELKNPTVLPEPNALMDFRYVAQGLFYVAKADRNGVKFDAAMLAHFHIPGQDGLAEWIHDPDIEELFVQKIMTSLKRGHTPKIDFVFQEIDRDLEIIKQIYEVGSSYWHDYVMKGLVPGLPKKPELKLSDEQLASCGQVGYEYLRYKELEKAAAEQAAERSAVLQSLVNVEPLAPLPFGVTVQNRSSFDVPRAEALLRAKGFDPRKFSEETWDTPAMADALIARGVDVDSFRFAGAFDKAKALALLAPEEIELLTMPKPTVALHARSSDVRVKTALGKAGVFAKEVIESAGEMMAEGYKAEAEAKTKTEASDGKQRSRPKR